jgi:hypothetical protein
VSTSDSGLTCPAYTDEWFHDPDGGNPGGGMSCWDDPADAFAAATYSDFLDAVLVSPSYVMASSSTTLTFDHRYLFQSTTTLRPDGAVVEYSVNNGPWQKLTTLPYNGPLIYNTYCNPLCNTGGTLAGTIPCFTENLATPDGENVFALLNSASQVYTTVAGALSGVSPGDGVRFRWRVGTMELGTAFGFPKNGGYSVDDVSVTNVATQSCDPDNNSNTGCEGCTGNPPGDPAFFNVTEKVGNDAVFTLVPSGTPGVRLNVYRDTTRTPALWGIPVATGLEDEDPGLSGVQFVDRGALLDMRTFYYLATEQAVCNGAESPLF